MKQVGSVEIPQKAFLAILEGGLRIFSPRQHARLETSRARRASRRSVEPARVGEEEMIPSPPTREAESSQVPKERLLSRRRSAATRHREPRAHPRRSRAQRKKLGAPVKPQELARSRAHARRPLPPSYRAMLERRRRSATARSSSTPTRWRRRKNRSTRPRSFRFAKAESTGSSVSIAKRRVTASSPFTSGRTARPRLAAKSFAEWLDGVADRVEEAIASAADVPQTLRSLLAQLGFRSTTRSSAGSRPATSRRSRSSSAPSSRARCEETSSGCSTRAARRRSRSTSTSSRSPSRSALASSSSKAEDVFRWLRYFRDENFFGDTSTPSASRRESRTPIACAISGARRASRRSCFAA